ncbi:hypothetical protein [Thalassomonas actiniarum]|uniref:hypothetical protein n=1 Tax=Thalassomonas actiniarum TaxID=485447 RepID=UPI0005E43F13|nr:hypothetical protein [Thalassomonas actiniarum]
MTAPLYVLFWLFILLFYLSCNMAIVFSFNTLFTFRYKYRQSGFIIAARKSRSREYQPLKSWVS